MDPEVADLGKPGQRRGPVVQRTDLDDVTPDIAEVRHPPGDEVVEVARELSATDCPPVCPPDEGPVHDALPKQLADPQRIALRAIGQLPSDLGGVTAQHLLDQSLDVVDPEWREGHVDEVRQRHELVPSRSTEDHDLHGASANEPDDDVEADAIDPLEIVDHEHRRAPIGQGPDRRPHEPPARRSGREVGRPLRRPRHRRHERRQDRRLDLPDAFHALEQALQRR